jgi:hypothetical protein
LAERFDWRGDIFGGRVERSKADESERRKQEESYESQK